MDSEDKRLILDYLYNYNLGIVKEYSITIYNSLYIGWQNYVGIQDKARRKKYREKLNKMLDKLNKKKIENIAFIDNSRMKLDYLQEYDLLNAKFKSNLMDDIIKKETIGEYLCFLLDKYDEVEFIEKRKKKKKSNVKLDLPYQIKKTERVYVDEDGYCYYHIRIVNGAMIVSEASLKTEKQMYIKALKDNKDVFKENDREIKLAPFEKKRRIYIENIYALEKEIRDFYNRKMDLTYPLERFYMFSKKIADGLYYEMMRPIEKKDIFDYIMNITVENYNYGNVLADYSKGIGILQQYVRRADEILKVELGNEASRLKHNVKYMDFEGIKGLVPDVRDIYDIVSKKVIKNLNHNYVSNNRLLEDNVRNMTKYMDEKSIVEYYKVYCDVYNINKCNIECYKVLQKSIVKVLKERFNVTEKVIFGDMLKEKKIY